MENHLAPGYETAFANKINDFSAAPQAENA